jgi:hypothetical protein
VRTTFKFRKSNMSTHAFHLNLLETEMTVISEALDLYSSIAKKSSIRTVESTSAS